MAKEIKDDLGTIIVNGVDVSDCCYIQEGAECEAYQTECEAQVCYYQQLKRKEQELQQVKETLKDHDSEGEAIGLAYDALKSEFDKLKAENEELKKKLF